MNENQFSSLDLSPEVLKAIEDVGYEAMTPIQEKIIPLVLEGRDVIGQSSTGTGKTAAFAIPCVELTQPSEDGLAQILVLAPTRELAIQICDEMNKFAKYKEGLKAVPVYGGHSINVQIKSLQSAPIVVGTPGRIIDHIKRGTLKLDNVRLVVLDEADEMLDMGFFDDIRYILRCCPERRQTLLFSATMPTQILRLTQRFQHFPEHIKGDDGQTAFELIDQYYCEVPKSKKASSVILLMEKLGIKRALIFCNTKQMVDILADHMTKKGLAAVALHGDMRQTFRSHVMKAFKAGDVNILIATDVAARGIDATGVEAIINYDIPQDVEYYVHRIGRTGRAGHLGASYTIIGEMGDYFDLGQIEEKTGAKMQPFELDGTDELPDDKLSRPRRDSSEGGGSRRSSNGSGRRSSGSRTRDKGNTVLLTVDVGSQHDIKSGHIANALVRQAGIRKQDIGKITVGETESFIELSAENAKKVLENISDPIVNDFLVEFKAADSAPIEVEAGASEEAPRPRRPRRRRR